MGSPGKPYDGIGAGSLVFSPNGQRLAYVAQVGKQQVVVVDGQASKPYKGIAVGSLVFSADSQHVAYAANDEEEDAWFVVLDGQAGKPYEAWVTGPVFSPDSQRLAYAVAVDEAKQVVVVDGRESKAYNGIKVGLLAFSPRQSAPGVWRPGRQRLGRGAGWPGRQALRKSAQPGRRQDRV